MNPVLKPGLGLTRRDERTLLLGRHPWRTVVLPDDPSTHHVLRRLDGTHTLEALPAVLAADGVDPARTAHLLSLLRAAGALDDDATLPEITRHVADDHRCQLHADLDAWSAATDEPAGGRRTLARRRARWMVVDGDPRLALPIAKLLSASWIGHVELRTSEPVIAERHLSLIGPGRDDLDRDPINVVSDLSTTPLTKRKTRSRRLRTVPSPDGIAPDPPDLTIAVGPTWSPRAVELLRLGHPHLFVDAVDGHGIVGPLVIPGRTACGQCVDHGLCATDPAHHWHTLTAADAIGPIDGTTLTAVAALAVAQALQQVEQQTRPASINAQLIVDPVGALVTRQPVQPHSGCGCQQEPAPEQTDSAMQRTAAPTAQLRAS